MSLLLLLKPAAGGGGGPPPAAAAESTSVVARPPDRVPVIAAAPVTVRHIIKGTGANQVTVVGATFIPAARRGVNGRRGYSTGTYETVLNDEGKGTLVLPNTVGDDGVLHRRRFRCLTDPGYHPGDEWLEIVQDGRATPLFVGTPIDWEKRRATVSLELVDALWMQNTQRETAAGFWAHAPRDVFEHYTKAWVPVVADDFDQGADPERWTAASASSLPTAVRLAPTELPLTAFIDARSTYWPGIELATERVWRLEATYDRTITGSSIVTLMMSADDFSMVALEVGVSGTTISLRSAGGTIVDSQTLRPTFEPVKRGATLAIEGRDRWVLFYVDGQLALSLELDTVSEGVDYYPAISLQSGDSTTSVVDVQSLLLRRCDPHLMRGGDAGDYRRPGLLPSGGLRATYFDESDLRSHGDTTAAYYRRALAPTREPYARRQDTTIDFPTSNPLTWQPPTPPNGEYFTARWTGAIALDLAAADVTLRITQLDNAVRLWVGKTMYGEQLLDQWTSPSGAPFTLTTGGMRAHLGEESGWYPIRIDFAQGAAPGGIVFQRSVGGGAYEVVPAAALSPYGIYEAQVRYDSHAEQLKAIALAYGLQYRCEPRALESGQFPGEAVPRVRVGRDTDKVLTPDESTDVSVRGSAIEVVDALLADAAGLGDQANAAQLTSEAINYPGVTPGEHMMIASAYESLADITDPALLQTRLASMLGLRITTWEEVGARPRGHRELRDTFPLTGAAAAFAWEPGDGVRVEDDAIDLRDDTPRQIIAPAWTFNPDGLGAPTVRFRQRPRSQQDALRALVRATLLPQRNYQGQLVAVHGSFTHLDGAISRVSLPRDLDDVVRCELVIGHKSDASAWSIKDHPAAATIATFTTVGRIDLLAHLQRRPDSYAGVGQTFLVSIAGGTGTAEAQLEILVRV